MHRLVFKCLVKFLAVIVSFLIHGVANKEADRKDIRYTLETVRAELITNAEHISQIREYIDQERKSAEYLIEHRTSLDKCPADSVTFHSDIINRELEVKLSDNATDLLQSSPVSRIIDGNGLLMTIIRAYDTCDWIVSDQNRRAEARKALLDILINDQTLFLAGNTIDIPRFIGTESGLFAVNWISQQPDPSITADIADIQDAIDGIDEFLAIKRLPVRRFKILN